jgi:ribosomal protein S12 methylthiotransferase accessory factor
MRRFNRPGRPHNTLGYAVVSAAKNFVEGFDDVIEADYQRMMRLVDPVVGIVSHLYIQFREPDDPFIYNATSILANTGRYTEQGIGSPPQGNGAAGLTMKRCLVSAIGESVERYGCSVVDRKEEVFGSFNQLATMRIPCFPPERIALFSALQYDAPSFPFRRFTRETPVAWTPCDMLSGGASPTTIYYPSSLIFMPYTPRAGETVVAPTISTGQACGRNLTEATFTGLMESIERDAYVIAWHNRISSPTIDPNSSPLVREFLSSRFRNCPLHIKLNLLTLDIAIPVVVATGFDLSNPKISFCLGIAANPDPEIAAIKALIELAQDRFYIKYLARTRTPVYPSPDFRHIDDFEKRVILYLRPELLGVFDFWRNSQNRVLSFDHISALCNPVPEPNSALDHCCRLVSEAGCTIIRKICTPADVGEAKLAVAKVIVPEFAALEGDHNARFLGSERMYRVPVATGFRRSPIDMMEINPYPHPLP